MTAAEQIGDGETLTVLEAPFTSAAEVAQLSYPLIPVNHGPDCGTGQALPHPALGRDRRGA